MRKLSFIVAVASFVVGSMTGHGNLQQTATTRGATLTAAVPFDLAASIGQGAVRRVASLR